ncbi:MAG: hypothetical protein KIT58_18250 [Planctomycetota bacterium]|nr:hypothetical protein [Planctomycetota bacterium]
MVAIEDLERANLHQAGHVVDYFRRAVEDVITAQDWSQRHEERVREQLRTRCSFHLFVPMIEAYFFAHAGALQHLKAVDAPRFDPTVTDMEQFAVAAHPGLEPGDERLVHPKRYANFLCDPSGALDRAYNETKQGLQVLANLDWSIVLSNPDHGRFLRALFHDLAWGLEVDPAPFPGQVAGETRVRDDGLLRNL